MRLRPQARRTDGRLAAGLQTGLCGGPMCKVDGVILTILTLKGR